MKKLIYLFSLFIALGCNRSVDNWKEIKMEFAHSFSIPLTYTLDISNSTIHQSCVQTSYYTTSNKVDTILNGQIYYTEVRRDTLITIIDERFIVSKTDLNNFLKVVEQIELDSNVSHGNDYLDGGGFRFNQINIDNDTLTITCWNPDRSDEFKKEYQILDAFFELADASIDDYKGICLTENYHIYYFDGLPIKEVNNNPLEYRIWGSIYYGSGEDNQEFLKFLENLPSDKPIIFDLRNGSIAYRLNEVLEEYSQKKEIYLYGDRRPIEAKVIMDEIKLVKKNRGKLSEKEIIAYEIYEAIYEKWKNNKKIKSFSTKEEVIKTIANKN